MKTQTELWKANHARRKPTTVKLQCNPEADNPELFRRNEKYAKIGKIQYKM